ncbi:MAG: glutathionylspermidine synthase family protein [Pseudomonadota bacterium]
MERLSLPERANLPARLEESGFSFHEMHGERYWDERAAYRFTLAQIEDDLEDPATALQALCLDLVAEVVESDALMARLGVPEPFRDFVAASWRDRAPSLYGRMDMAYTGQGPAKLLEYNADTPTSVFETASFQWTWLEDARTTGLIPKDSDQFNGLHEALVERFRALAPEGIDLHFSAFQDSAEDFGTVEYLAWAAQEAGLVPHFVDVRALGASQEGDLLDDQGRVIGALFKLYPWEDFLREGLAEALPGARNHFLEPAWKGLLSNKGMLALLWERHPGHPNLLPAWFGEDIEAGRADLEAVNAAFAQGWVSKPLFSREGAGVEIWRGGQRLHASAPERYAEHPRIHQAYTALPETAGNHPVLGLWIVGEACCALGIREDRDPITRDLSRFLPHYIDG